MALRSSAGTYGVSSRAARAIEDPVSIPTRLHPPPRRKRERKGPWKVVRSVKASSSWKVGRSSHRVLCRVLRKIQKSE